MNKTSCVDCECIVSEMWLLVSVDLNLTLQISVTSFHLPLTLEATQYNVKHKLNSETEFLKINWKVYQKKTRITQDDIRDKGKYKAKMKTWMVVEIFMSFLHTRIKEKET